MSNKDNEFRAALSRFNSPDASGELVGRGIRTGQIQEN